jgi:cytochrome c
MAIVLSTPEGVGATTVMLNPASLIIRQVDSLRIKLRIVASAMHRDRMIRDVTLAAAFLVATSTHARAQTSLGERMMLRCQTCHAVKAGAPAKVGPNLNGMFGRKAASLPGYTFSKPLRASGIVWTEATLNSFLERPSKMVPGTLMAFAGLPKAEERAALIAWLKANTK